MAVAIDATVGGASSNSFVTLAEANTYMEGRLNADDWEVDASDDTKNRALVEAARDLDVRTWDGYRVTDTQALAWPRQWAHDPDSPTQDYFATTAVPQRVKDAQCELAWEFVRAGTTDVAALDEKDNVKRKKIDVIDTEYFSPAGTREGLRRYPRVWNLISPLLVGSGITTPVVRGG